MQGHKIIRFLYAVLFRVLLHSAAPPVHFIFHYNPGA